MHGRPTGLFITASCFLYQLLSCLSLSSFSWSLSSPSAGKWGFEDRARGSHWHNGRPYLKVPSKPLKIIKFSLQFQFGEGSDLLKVFVYRPNNFNFRSDCGTYGIPFIIGIFGREITKNTAIYGVYIRFWPTLRMCKGRLQYTFTTTDYRQGEFPISLGIKRRKLHRQ